MEKLETFSLVEEESLVLPDDELIVEQKAVTKTQSEDRSNQDLDFIVLAVNNKAFKINKPSFEIEIYGKSMLDWVKSVCISEPKVKEIEVKHNILEEIRPLLGDGEYTIVLYSDSPLITKATIEEAYEFTVAKGLNVCRLTHGFVFKTEYVKRAFDIFSTETYYFNEEDFMIAFNFSQVALIGEIIKNRILNYHMQNGVYITDPSSTFIGSEVKIGRDVTIYSDNNIYGKSEIGNNVILKSKNTIKDSVLQDGVVVSDSKIKQSVIKKGSDVFSSNIENTLVGENNKISSGTNIISSRLGNSNTVTNTYISRVNIGNNCSLNPNSTIMSTKKEILNIKDNVVVGAGVTISIPVVVGENATIIAGTCVKNDVPKDSVYSDKTEYNIKPKQ